MNGLPEIRALVLRALRPHQPLPRGSPLPISSSSVLPWTRRWNSLSEQQPGFLDGRRGWRVHSTASAAASRRSQARSRGWNNTRTGFFVLGSGVLTTSLLYLLGQSSTIAHAEAPAQSLTGPDSSTSPAASTTTPRKIRLAEVRAHDNASPRKWVIRGVRVYDITDWIPAHPGGDVILRAVGSNIDPYWEIFSIHKSADVDDILESYFIGEIDPADLVEGKVPSSSVEDPFANDPVRDGRLIVRTAKPCNAETPAAELGSFITPNETFYVRQHLWVPECRDADAHTLHIELADGSEASYTLGELKARFAPVTITATLQCSGNRRAHMSAEARAASGLQWEVGAISNAAWTGVRLRDVLKDAGFPVDEYDADDVKHVQFTGAEAYGSSIPIDKAVARHGDVLLAWAMNGAPIPPDHGAPLRLLAPGIVAARSVKWLSKIVLSEEESSSQWQQKDYKCFGPNVRAAAADWAAAPAIQEMPVQSAITSLKEISCSDRRDRDILSAYGLEEDAVEVEGYAYSGGGRRIIRVDVSADDGRSWHQAELLPDAARGSKSWSWTQWRWVIPRGSAGRVFVCKAVDDGYNSQAEGYESAWNFRGNLTSSWHRVGFSNRGS